MEENLLKLENELNDLENILNIYENKYDNFGNMENQIETNLEASKLNKEFAYTMATIYLGSKKIGNKLNKDDPVLKQIKKIQKKSGRIQEVEKNLFDSKNKKINRPFKKSIDSHDFIEEKLKKRQSYQ